MIFRRLGSGEYSRAIMSGEVYMESRVIVLSFGRFSGLNDSGGVASAAWNVNSNSAGSGSWPITSSCSSFMQDLRSFTSGSSPEDEKRGET